MAHSSLDEQDWTWRLNVIDFRSIKHIGLDLDNTIIDYSDSYRIIAENLKLKIESFDRNSIRNELRKSEFDDLEWQYFQSLLYTVGLQFAKPAAGLFELLNYCKESEIKITIVSHKTLTTPANFGSQDLRSPAFKWLTDYHIIPEYITPANLFFCSSADEKIETIDRKRIDLFVDDLIEILRICKSSSDMTRMLYRHSAKEVSLYEDSIYSCNFFSLTNWISKC